jgi:hypothetical protein
MPGFQLVWQALKSGRSRNQRGLPLFRSPHGNNPTAIGTLL